MYMTCGNCEAEAFTSFHGEEAFDFETEDGGIECRKVFPWLGHHYEVRNDAVDIEALCRGAWEAR